MKSSMPDRDCIVRHLLVLFLTMIVLCAGCAGEDPQLLGLRQQLTLETEPADATTIAVAKDGLAANPKVSFIGRIAADEREAFVDGKAAFIVTEILPEEQGHGGNDHAANCPFCKHKAAAAPWAAVEVLNESGELLEIDARKLFGVQPDDIVIVQGQGEFIAELDLFQVTAESIFVRSGERS